MTSGRELPARLLSHDILDHRPPHEEVGLVQMPLWLQRDSGIESCGLTVYVPLIGTSLFTQESVFLFFSFLVIPPSLLPALSPLQTQLDGAAMGGMGGRDGESHFPVWVVQNPQEFP